MVFGLGFRTRSSSRDKEGDQARINGVRQALLAAKASAELESAGLRRRINEWRSRAVAIMDTSGSYGTRDVEEENEITAATKAAVSGERRLETISKTLEIFDRMLKELAKADRPVSEEHDD